MPTIRLHGRPDTFQTNLVTSVLNALLRGGYPIETICGGRAHCGRDLIRIHAGAGFFSPVREPEERRLRSLAAEGEPSGPDIRLACQSFVRGDVEIEVLHHRGGGKA
jgi:ferredoxin